MFEATWNNDVLESENLKHKHQAKTPQAASSNVMHYQVIKNSTSVCKYFYPSNFSTICLSTVLKHSEGWTTIIEPPSHFTKHISWV